jgi:superfamily II RNA helicase
VPAQNGRSNFGVIAETVVECQQYGWLQQRASRYAVLFGVNKRAVPLQKYYLPFKCSTVK